MCVPYSSICLLQALTIAIIVPIQVKGNEKNHDGKEPGRVMKMLYTFGVVNEKESESEDDIQDWYI